MFNICCDDFLVRIDHNRMPEFLLTKRKNNNNYSFNYPTPSLLRPVLSVVFDYYFTLQYIIYSIPSYVNAVFIFSGEEVVQRPLYILPVHACEQQMRPRVLCMWRTHGLNHCFHFIFLSFFFSPSIKQRKQENTQHTTLCISYRRSVRTGQIIA